MIRKTALALIALLILFVLFQLITFPRVSRLREENPETTAFMERRKEELREAGKSDDLQHTWVPYERISSHLRSAVIVSEDSRFYDHEGVDTEELDKILREAWEKKELGRGGSTITQQLAKNLYLSPSRNPWRKVREILIARRMEQVLSKKRILELYLNSVEFGERVYGAEAAARHYFGRSAASLSPAQAALLAGALPNPRKMNPGDPGPYLRSRRDIILSRMRRWGYMAEKSVSDPSSDARSSNPEADEEMPTEDVEPATEELPPIIDETSPDVTATEGTTDEGTVFDPDEPLPPDFVPADEPDPEPPTR